MYKNSSLDPEVYEGIEAGNPEEAEKIQVPTLLFPNIQIKTFVSYYTFLPSELLEQQHGQAHGVLRGEAGGRDPGGAEVLRLHLPLRPGRRHFALPGK